MLRKNNPISTIYVAATFAVAAIVSGCYPGAGAGRDGNKAYEQGDYETATASYQQGLNDLALQEEPPNSGSILAGLHNNKGASNYRMEEFAESQDAFTRSVATSDNNIDRSLASYNAGNAAYGADEKKLATDFYKLALLSDPTNLDAKYNYELVQRQLQDEKQDDQSSQGDPPPPPSEYAKELKEQALELIAQRLYREAEQLLQNGLKIDPSVQAFQELIDRTTSIADLAERDT